MALSLSLARLDARVRGEHLPADIPARLDAALAAQGANGRPVQLIADLHGADSYRRCDAASSSASPAPSSPDLDLGDRDAQARAGWSNSTRSGGPPTTRRPTRLHPAGRLRRA